MDGRKVVRVNDARLAVLSTGTFVVAVDVGLDGLLRRLGVANETGAQSRKGVVTGKGLADLSQRNLQVL